MQSQSRTYENLPQKNHLKDNPQDDVKYFQIQSEYKALELRINNTDTLKQKDKPNSKQERKDVTSYFS
jgi:hypothetical protein